ncbi:hypothetical protein [Streptomyces herbicida]|uniref:hypothetical protein n=1 Tax=Streptomyces herbicida TaxID=3065675 RepID=UPI00292E104D|nr:hypothetical protein [Streptomyces sp. NEAU-HV9]
MDEVSRIDREIHCANGAKSNRQALRHLHSWQQAGTDMPEGYDTHVRFQGRRPA